MKCGSKKTAGYFAGGSVKSTPVAGKKPAVKKAVKKFNTGGLLPGNEAAARNASMAAQQRQMEQANLMNQMANDRAAMGRATATELPPAATDPSKMQAKMTAQGQDLAAMRPTGVPANMPRRELVSEAPQRRPAAPPPPQRDMGRGRLGNVGPTRMFSKGGAVTKKKPAAKGKK